MYSGSIKTLNTFTRGRLNGNKQMEANMAPRKVAVTINFDGNITGVVDNDGTTFASSGGANGIYNAGATYTFTVTTVTGYEIANVTLDSTSSSTASISNITANTFDLNVGDVGAVLTITSKQSGGTMSETWLLNEVLNSLSLTRFDINFVSNNVSYLNIARDYNPSEDFDDLIYGQNGSAASDDTVYSNGSWINQANRTIIFSTPPTGDLLTWAQANGPKQQSLPTIKAGTYKFKETPILVSSIISQDLNSKIDNVSYITMVVSSAVIATMKGVGDVGPTLYNSSTGWTDTKYRTIVIETDQNVSEDFYTWFTTNANEVIRKSVDLTTLSGWEALLSGSHSITIKAKAAGYLDSDASEAVTVTKADTKYSDCLTFTGENEQDFTLTATQLGWDGTLEYSTDHSIWTTFDGPGVEMSSANGKLYLRGNGNTTLNLGDYVELALSAKAACSGNIMTLLQYDNPPTSITTEACFSGLFHLCENLTAAPELPATILSPNCYESMFAGCTNLKTAPELPATTLADGCYYQMFADCSNLKVNTSSGTKIFTCPTEIPSDAVTDMFINTGGSFTGTPAAGVTYYYGEEPSTSETWLLNQTIIFTDASFVINFNSNGIDFTTISMENEPKGYLQYENDSFSDTVYDNAGIWIDSAYRTITFETAPTGDLLTWLNANGTKQGGVTPELITFTVVTAINGSVVRYEDCKAEAGMTFGEWLTSSYNTHNVVNPPAKQDCPEDYMPMAEDPDATLIEGSNIWLIKQLSVEA